MIRQRVASICARFNGYPSDYLRNHDWIDLSIDYEITKVLNQIDQEKDKAYWNSMNPKK